MAIVQLVHLHPINLLGQSEFWYYNLNTPNQLLGGVERPKAIGELVKKSAINASSGFASREPTSAWKTRSNFPAQIPTPGIPIRISVALAWTEERVVETTCQPPAPFWITQAAEPRPELSEKRVIAVHNLWDEALMEYKNFIGV